MAYSKGEWDMSETMTQTTEDVKATNEQKQQQLMDQLSKPEVQESLTQLIEQLPKITEMLNGLANAYSVTQTLAKDEVFLNDTKGAVKEIIEPLVDEVKNIAATAIEAKDRADDSKEVIGVFGLMKMLKDPQAQKLFRFINAYLKVAGENSKS